MQALFHLMELFLE